MHCLEDFRKYFFEIILTDVFENFPLYGITYTLILFCKDREGSPSQVLQRLLESDEFADTSSRITSRDA